MRSADDQPSNAEKVLRALLVVIWLALAVWILTGCTLTVHPDRVETTEASYDGNVQNSGIVMSTENGFLVTDHFRDRYNALIETYGRDFAPPLKKDAGMSRVGEDRWLLTKQRWVDFDLMNSWRKAGLKPTNP